MKKLLLVVLLLIGATTAAADPSDDGRVLRSLDQINALTVMKITRKTHVKGAIKNFRLFDYVMATPDNREVHFAYYKKMGTQQKRPVVFIVPAIGGFTPMETLLAAYFASREYNVVVAKISANITDVTRAPEDIEKMFLETNADTRGIIDYIADLPETDKTKMVAIGTSLGGIRLSMLLAVEKRIKAATFIVTGGDLPEIMATSEQNSVKKYRLHCMHERGIQSPADYQVLISKNLEIDPLVTAKYLTTKNILMFRSSIDKDVPFQDQTKLWLALGKPLSYQIRLPHIPAAGYVAAFKAPTIHRFFQERFAK